MLNSKKFKRTPSYNIKSSWKSIILIEQYFPLIKANSLSKKSFVTTIHRILPIRLLKTAKPSIDFIKQNEWIPAALLVRACAETTSIIYAIYQKAKELAVTKNYKSFELFCAKIIMSTKIIELKEERLRAPNILTFIQKLDKEIPEFYFLYQVLSEYCHPNIFGWFLYSDEYFINTIQKKAILKSKGSTRETAEFYITLMLRLSLSNAIRFIISTERILEIFYPKDVLKTQSARLKKNPSITNDETIIKDFYLHNLYLLEV